jgi:hypothetical protein
MGEASIIRRSRATPITLTTSVSGSDTLRLDDMAGGVVVMSTFSSNASTLLCYGATASDATFRRIFGADGSPADVTLSAATGESPTSEGRVYSLPDAVFAVPFLKIVSGTTNSTGTEAVVVFKS